MRNLADYLTGLKLSISDDAGEHPEAVAVASVMVIDALGDTPENRQITIQGQIFHSQEVFERNGKELLDLQSQFFGEAYLAELDAAPLTMLILSRHLQRKMRLMSVGKNGDGDPVTLEKAEAVPLPDYLNTPDLQRFIAQFDAIEQEMAAEIEKLKTAPENGSGQAVEIL